MGTHPIFESDFDCLTEMSSNEFQPEELGITEEDLRNLSAREVSQMCTDFSPEQVKAIKHKRRTLKNREYAAICRNRRTNQRDVLMKECSYYQTKIKDLENQNFLLKNTKIKLKEILNPINYIPFQQSNSNQVYSNVEVDQHKEKLTRVT